ncbi:MAG: hypothetical protein K1Y36_19680 [Blastocatellia bacterium]|nr:hypothetical protein [Blastocatellia bacterium]
MDQTPPTHAPPSQRCCHCGAQVATTWEFCMTCGLRLDEAVLKEISHIDYLLQQVHSWPQKQLISQPVAHKVTGYYQENRHHLIRSLLPRPPIPPRESTEQPFPNNLTPLPEFPARLYPGSDRGPAPGTPPRPETPPSGYSGPSGPAPGTPPRPEPPPFTPPQPSWIERLSAPQILMWMVYGGAGLFVIGTLVYLRDVIAQQLRQPVVQAGLLALLTIGALASGIGLLKRTQQRLAGRGLVLLGSLLIPVNPWFLVHSGLLPRGDKAWAVGLFCTVAYGTLTVILNEPLLLYLALPALLLSGFGILNTVLHAPPDGYALLAAIFSLVVLYAETQLEQNPPKVSPTGSLPFSRPFLHVGHLVLAATLAVYLVVYPVVGSPGAYEIRLIIGDSAGALSQAGYVGLLLLAALAYFATAYQKQMPVLMYLGTLLTVWAYSSEIFWFRHDQISALVRVGIWMAGTFLFLRLVTWFEAAAAAAQRSGRTYWLGGQYIFALRRCSYALFAVSALLTLTTIRFGGFDVFGTVNLLVQFEFFLLALYFAHHARLRATMTLSYLAAWLALFIISWDVCAFAVRQQPLAGLKLGPYHLWMLTGFAFLGAALAVRRNAQPVTQGPDRPQIIIETLWAVAVLVALVNGVHWLDQLSYGDRFRVLVLGGQLAAFFAISGHCTRNRLAGMAQVFVMAVFATGSYLVFTQEHLAWAALWAVVLAVAFAGMLKMNPVNDFRWPAGLLATGTLYGTGLTAYLGMRLLTISLDRFPRFEKYELLSAGLLALWAFVQAGVLWHAPNGLVSGFGIDTTETSGPRFRKAVVLGSAFAAWVNVFAVVAASGDTGLPRLIPFQASFYAVVLTIGGIAILETAKLTGADNLWHLFGKAAFAFICVFAPWLVVISLPHIGPATAAFGQHALCVFATIGVLGTYLAERRHNRFMYPALGCFFLAYLRILIFCQMPETMFPATILFYGFVLLVAGVQILPKLASRFESQVRKTGQVFSWLGLVLVGLQGILWFPGLASDQRLLLVSLMVGVVAAAVSSFVLRSEGTRSGFGWAGFGLGNLLYVRWIGFLGFEIWKDVEIYAVPLGVALLVTGYINLRRGGATETLGRFFIWQGSLMACVPTLLHALQSRFFLEHASYRSDITLDTISLLMILAGVILPLRAPLMVGIASLSIHLLAVIIQFVPWGQIHYAVYLSVIGASLFVAGWMLNNRRERIAKTFSEKYDPPHNPIP